MILLHYYVSRNYNSVSNIILLTHIINEILKHIIFRIVYIHKYTLDIEVI